MDQNKLKGYLVEITCVGFVGVTYFISQGAHLLLFISLAQHHHAFSEIFRQLLSRTDESDDDVQNTRILHGSIRFYATVKKYRLIQFTVIASALDSRHESGFMNQIYEHRSRSTA